MTKYAVIKLAGSQYKVAEGDELKVTIGEVEKDKTLTFEEVLLVGDGDKVEVGQPFVTGTVVTAKILGQEKGDKVRIATYKAKARYRKVKGFRPKLAHLKIEKISVKSR